MRSMTTTSICSFTGASFPAMPPLLWEARDRMTGVMKPRVLLVTSVFGIGVLLLAQAPSSDVTFKRLLAADKEPQNWLTYSGTMMSQRYSSLTQITTANVKNLEETWELKTQTGEKFE